MRWESLVSVQNLRLAWRRINTGLNLQHKRFFRELYLVYETALDENLRLLREQLLNKAWDPTHPERLYVPKPSGLQRPISLLGIEDQILLQAVANVFARKLATKRRKVESETVFSNILSDSLGSIFFTRPWRETYGAFQDRCRALFEEGNPWIGHFDLAAYYDTISHDMLLRVVSPRGAHRRTWDEVKKWLEVWSSSDASTTTSHGIPQGPVASGFLGEAFFLPIDIELKRKGIKYVRYVDDIRLFGESENEARQAGIALERLCRDRGLIPQGKKFLVERAKTATESLGSLPSIPPTQEGEDPHPMTVKKAIRLLSSCVKGSPLRVKNKSRFRYVMYRAPRDPKILNKVMLLLPRYPEHIDEFTAYFSSYGTSKKIAKGAAQVLRSGLPYAYVRGELWHLLARLGTRDQLGECTEMARHDARRRKECLGLSWGVMHFLIRCQEEGLCRIGTRLKTEIPLSRALLASRMPASEFAPGGVAISMLKGTVEEQLAAARQLQTRQCSLSKLNLRQGSLPKVCQHSLRALGVVRRVSRASQDWIAERLQQRHGGKVCAVWRSLLVAEYEHALQILIAADAMYDADPSPWLQLQDSFNDVVVRKFITYLQQRQRPGGNQAIINRKGELVSYGVLLQPTGPLAAAFPSIGENLRVIHARRSRLPGSHPYDAKGGARNAWLKRSERDDLLPRAGDALRDIAGYVANNP